MESVMVGEHPGVSSITFLPMIDFNPTSHSCMYTTLKFLADEARKQKVDVPVITFDQCLWIKALEVINAKKDEFSKIVIRLGGFHTLMSFLGSIGHLMGGSGLEDVLQLVYAANAVPHMLTGKAYARSVRGHLLVSSMLNAMLVADVLDYTLPVTCTPPSPIDSDEPNSIPEDQDMEIQRDNEVVDELTSVFDQLSACEITVENAILSPSLTKLCAQLEEKKKHLENESRTSKLWLMYLHMINIVKNFIWAEKTGNFQAHLRAVEHMLPFFASSGHNNYAKSARIYVQQMRELEKKHPAVYKMLNDGHFTIRRKDKMWAGTCSDMVIEQSLMRSTKGRGGLTRGGGMSEHQRALWILSLPASTEVTYALCEMTGVRRVGSEQHVDISHSRMNRDLKDTNKILLFFNDHNPFKCNTPDLTNIFSGITDSQHQVNVENAESIGRHIHDGLTDKALSNVTMTKSKQAVTMRILKKGIVIDGETHRVDTRLLTQRMLLCIALDKDSDQLPGHFEYELSTTPPSLFEPTTEMMRKGDKATLATHLDKLVKNSDVTVHEYTYYVLDGGALVQILPWPRTGTFADVLHSYDKYIDKHYGKVTVVFDGYDTSSTKDMEHNRRAKKNTSANILFTETSPLLVGKLALLSNNENKQRFINMLGRHLCDKGHTVIHAKDDADVIIVKTALDISQEKHVTVVADDTDVLVMLVHHSTNGNITMQSGVFAKKQRTILEIQQSLGSDGCRHLTFVHALTGCDGTSFLFGRSKAAALRKICNDESLRACASLFGVEGDVNVKTLTNAGYRILVSLYSGNPTTQSLNTLRYELYLQKITTAKKEFEIARLPPTENAAYYHLLRVHYQCILWNSLNRITPDPIRWGWQRVNGQLQPITTDVSPAPDSLLNTIQCGCKIDVDEPCGNRCPCRRDFGLACSVVCKNCKGKKLYKYRHTCRDGE